MSDDKKLTTTGGAPVADNQNAMTAGPRGPMLLQDVWFLEKLAHFDREVIPERRMHAKGSGAYGTFTVTRDITRYTKARIFAKVGKKTDLFVRFSTVRRSAMGLAAWQLGGTGPRHAKVQFGSTAVCWRRAGSHPTGKSAP